MIDFTGHAIGRYKILERIGQGGMAVVYKALDTRLGNEVALKFIKKEEFPASAQEGMLQRFEREARLMASLNHPNIVKVMDYGEYEGYPYLVMPYLAGGTLKARMGKPIPWREAVRIILPLTQALEYAHKHQKGALHRDIKPSNILLTESNEPVLTDFGIAKILENEEQHTLTGTGTGMGTPEYMAPEQWVKKEVDRRADVYALGVVMYELLTGRQPYKADTPAAVMLKQATEPLPRPRMLVADLPEKVEQVVLKALAKEPDNRYSSMGEFGKALEGLTAERGPFELPKWVVPVLISLLGVGMLTACIAWLVIPGIGRIQTYLVERGQTATAQAVIQATEARHATQTAIAASWTATPSPALIAEDQAATLAAESTRAAQTANAAAWTATPSPSPIISTETISLSVPPACTEIGQEWVSPVDGMTLVCVPAGKFSMGSNDGNDDEKPVHEVYMDAFWIDQTEVTIAQYRQCMDDGACTAPSQQNGYLSNGDRPIDYFTNSQYADYPVVYVTWNQATAYCSWAERVLPTEAQWEKAARGTYGRTYPWGNEMRSSYTNYGSAGTSPVGSYPTGASPYGALDMAGNVWEWVADWYGPYPSGEQRNLTGPATGDFRVLRGGSWLNDEYLVRSSGRSLYSPHLMYNYLGFRCASITNGNTIGVYQEQIVFVSRANGNSEIYSINIDGTNLTRLTNNSSEDVYPNYSPDGSKIVFSSKRTGKEQIYTMLADGTQQSRLLVDSYNDGVPEWSPDGTKIAFTRYGDFDGNGVRGEVFVMNSDGSNVIQLTTTSGKTGSYNHGCWTSGWSPDSTKILYYCYEGKDQIWMMNVDGSNKQLILNDSYWNAFPKMSPDGKKIVFVSVRNKGYDVYTVNPDGSSLTRLTTHSTDEWAPDWSPDGRKILFEANRDGKTQVYWMNADGTQQTMITDNTSYAGQCRWRP